MQFLSLFGPVDAVLEPILGLLILLLVVANMVTRRYSFRQSVAETAEADADDVGPSWIHVATNLLLLLASFYYLTLHEHAGTVLSVLVLGLVVTDYFDFEALRVDAREGRRLVSPKASLVASSLVLLYAAYTFLFYLVAPVWNAVV